MSSFLTHHGVLVALVCAAAAVGYGVLTSRALLALSPGNETMRTISAAVQEGARAYLNRQYTTIAAVGVVLFVALGFLARTNPIEKPPAARPGLRQNLAGKVQ